MILERWLIEPEKAVGDQAEPGELQRAKAGSTSPPRSHGHEQ